MASHHQRDGEPLPFGQPKDYPDGPRFVRPVRTGDFDRIFVPPVRPASAERLIVARRQRRIGIACVALSMLCILYMAAQIVRAVLS